MTNRRRVKAGGMFGRWLTALLLLLCCYQTTRALTTTQETVTVHPCATYGCINGGQYYWDSVYNRCRCNCTTGFAGIICNESAVVGLATTIAADNNVGILDAENYASEARAIIFDQVDQGYSKIASSATASMSVGATLVTKADEAAKKGDNLTSLTSELTGMTASVFTATTACATSTVAGCTLNDAQTKSIIEKTEENLGNMIHLMLNTQDKSTSPVPINKDDISMTVLKAKGKDMPSDYSTSYGSLTLPYWETFQGEQKGKDVLLSLISYKDSPYTYSPNKDEVTSSVVKINATDKKGKELQLSDPDDPITMSIDTSSVFEDETTWKEMDEFKSVDGAFMLVAAFNYSLNAIIIEMRIKTLKVCDIYGKYGYTEPSEEINDISIKTKGLNKIKEFKPDTLNIDFQNQVFRLTIINPNASEVMEPLVMTLLCEDYKLGAFGLPIHEYRIADVDLRYYNKELGTWNKSLDISLAASKGKSVGFKSSFFGTFSANVLFIPPEPIDFVSIFLNFSERILQTPHSLAASVGLIIIFLILCIPLSRLDRKDALLWSYLPLIDDNHAAGFIYEMAVFTDIRSPKRFTSKPYFSLTGEEGETGNRILLDGVRQNFGRGSSSHFTMRTLTSLGKLKELRIWHDNSGASPSWLLSRMVIVDKQTGERYVFICGDWLSEKHSDGQTWRSLYPAEPDELDGNIMLNEMSKNHLFEDHLWLSVSMRPHYSRFTRVQRLWTIVCLLFLSMIASAMWYNTSDPSSGSTVSLGPLKLNYKIVYVGFMSALIAALPSLIIMLIFKNRRLKGEGKHDNKINDSFELEENLHTELDNAAKDVENVPEKTNSNPSHSSLNTKPFDEGFGSMADDDVRSSFDLESEYSRIIQNTEANTLGVQEGMPNTNSETECGGIKKRKETKSTPMVTDYKDINLQNNFQESEECVLNYDRNFKYLNVLNSIQSRVSGVRDDLINLKIEYKAGVSEFNDMTNINSQSTSEYRISQSTIDLDNYYSKSVPVNNDNVAMTKEVWNNDKVVKEKPKKTKQRGPCLLPWGFIFIAYLLVLACVGSSTFFTFMYTLEWGPDTTVEWMTAFLFGTLQSVLVIEPVKAIFLALVVVCFCKRSAVGKLAFIGKPNDEIPNTTVKKPASNEVNELKEGDDNNIDDKSIVQVEDVHIFDYPGGKEEDKRVLEYKKKVQLDRKLVEKFRLLIGQCLYIAILAIICSHNIVTTSYYQNTDIANSLNISYVPKNSDDIWNWLEGYFVNTTFPKWYYNDQIREAYIQRYLKNTFNMRLGYARVRQVRVKGSCTVSDPMDSVVNICPMDYTGDSEETEDFCVDWVPFNETCFDENEETDYSFQYKTKEKTNAIPFMGTFGIYGGGGYYVDLGPKQSLVLQYLQRLRTDNWIDNVTRAVFADVVSYNPNLRIFNHLKVVFEKPVMGGVFMTSDIWSANLYPYVSSWDYVVLGFQILFVIILFVRIVLWLISICHLRTKCCFSVGMWVRLLEILFAIGAIVAYGIRIDKTISAIETLFNNFGRYTSFEIIHVLDVVYKTLISSVLFIAILELLKPLSFNYYIYLMRTSIYISRRELFGMFVLIFIPMFAFASLFYLFTGHTEKDFRDIPNSLFSLLLISIGMVDLSDKNQFGDIFIYFVYGTYTIVMTIIIISVFISVLSIAFNMVRSQKDLEKENTYDAELSAHLVNKFTNAFAKLITTKPAKKPGKDEKEKEENIVDKLMEKVNEVETFAKESNKAEVRYHRKLAYGMFGMIPKEQRLACLVCYQTDCTVLTYTDKKNDVLLKLFIQDVSWNEKIKVRKDEKTSVTVNFAGYHVSSDKTSPIFKMDGGSNMKTSMTVNVYDILNMSLTSDTRSAIFVNYDNKNWEKCDTEIVYPSSNESQIKFRTILQKCPKEIVVLSSNECEINSTQQQQQTVITDEFEIQNDGGKFTSSIDEKVTITVDPGTVTEDCILTVIVKPFGLSPLLQLTLSGDIEKPLRVTLPCTGKLQESTESIVLIREKDEEWVKVNVLLEVENETFKFLVPKANLQKGQPTTIIVKQSEIGWVDRSEKSKKALFDEKTLRTIASNITLRPSKLAEYLKSQITQDPFKVHNGQNQVINEQILKTWVNDSQLDDYDKMKQLEEILKPLGLSDLVQWLKDEEFKLRCSSSSNNESVRLIKGINMVARFEIIAKQWHDLAKILEVDEKFVQKIDTDIPRSSEEKCSLVLFQWFKESKSKTLADLSDIMKRKGFKKVAASLQKTEL